MVNIQVLKTTGSNKTHSFTLKVQHGCLTCSQAEITHLQLLSDEIGQKCYPLLGVKIVFPENYMSGGMNTRKVPDLFAHKNPSDTMYFE